MATGGIEEKHTLTLLWRIENLSHTEDRGIWDILESPRFEAQALEGSEFELRLKTNGKMENSLILRLFNRGWTLDFPIDCEWAFLGRNGSPLASGTVRNHILKEGIPLSLTDCPTKEDVFCTRKTLFLPEDTLIVRCRIWKSCGNLSNNELICFTSLFGMSENSFLWSIPNFSSLETNQEVITPVKFGFPDGLSEFRLRFSLQGASLEDASANLKLTVVSVHSLLNVFMKVYVLEQEKTSIRKKSQMFLSNSKEPLIFPKFVSRVELLSRKSDCLKDDVLNLRCEFKAIGCEPSNFIRKVDYGFPNPEVSNDASAIRDEM